MGKTEIDGDQVQDESLTGDDVKDESLLKADLSLAVQSEITANTAKVSDINHVTLELPNVDNTSDADKPVSTAQQTALDLKYDNTNPNGYETPAQLSVRDTNNRARANHTGTQLSSTVSNFASTVRATLLTGISFASSALVTASDSILVAIGKLQAQLHAAVFGRDAADSKTLINDTTSGSNWKLYADLVLNVSDTSGTNTYRINCDFLWGHDSASNDIRVRARVDGSTEKEIRIEPKDQGTDQRIQNNLLFYLSNLSAGNHTIELQYRPASSSRTSRMYRADLEAWRTK